jgi:PilZ domain.
MILYSGPTPLPAIDGRVIGLRIDPGNIDRCGFEAIFTQLSNAVLSQLSTLIEQLEQNIVQPHQEQLCPRPNSRQHPRVLTQLEAAIHLPQEIYRAKVTDLSIVGALLRLEQKTPSFNPGDELQVSIIAPNAPEHLSLRARVVRVVAGSEPPEVGVVFADINEIVQRRLEGLILDAFIEDYEPAT